MGKINVKVHLKPYYFTITNIRFWLEDLEFKWIIKKDRK